MATVFLLHSISLTRWAGIIAYTFSLGVCLLAWQKRRRSGDSDKVFAFLAAAQLMLLLDMIFEWRWQLHDYWMHEWISRGVYDQRRTPQAAALWLLILVAATLAFWLARALRGRPGAALASLSTLLSAGLWCCEAISYHFVDQVLYQMAGGLMLVSLIWVCLSVTVGLGAWLDRRGRDSRGRGSRRDTLSRR